VPIFSGEVAILVFGGIMVHGCVVNAWTARACPSGKGDEANRRSTALMVVVNVETNTGAIAGNLFTRGRRYYNWMKDIDTVLGRFGVLAVLVKLFGGVVTACKLQRTRLEDMDTLTSVDFEIPALLPVLVVHTRIIGVSTRAGVPNDSWKGQCDYESVQELHGCAFLSGVS
jgi:hypothetical protein